MRHKNENGEAISKETIYDFIIYYSVK
jgi:hypothetical protein